MATVVGRSLRERRDAVVREHVAAENRHDVEATIATFDRPRYEVMPFGDASDGETAVRELLQDLMGGFPDFHAEVEKTHHADEAVICEARITGTHNGSFAGIPPTGRQVDIPMVGIFDFDQDRLVCEKVFFDFAPVRRQVGVLPAPAS